MNDLEWLTRNSLRAYPVQEDAPVTAINTGWVLPDFMLADLQLVVPDAPLGVYLAAVTITAKIVSFVLASVATGQSLAVASVVQGRNVSFDKVAVTAMQPGVAGFVVIGTFLEPENFKLLQTNRGQHVFASSAVVETHCYIETGEFPVKSLSGYSLPKLSGAVSLEGGTNLVMSLSDGTEQGAPIRFIRLSLTDPDAFLSPCENKTTPCDCAIMPIHSINGVVPDADGIIFIEFSGTDGTITKAAASILNFLVTKTGDQLCVKPSVPDQYGRLPDAAGYGADAPPISPYKQVGDDTFPLPVI